MLIIIKYIYIYYRWNWKIFKCNLKSKNLKKIKKDKVSKLEMTLYFFKKRSSLEIITKPYSDYVVKLTPTLNF